MSYVEMNSGASGGGNAWTYLGKLTNLINPKLTIPSNAKEVYIQVISHLDRSDDWDIARDVILPYSGEDIAIAPMGISQWIRLIGVYFDITAGKAEIRQFYYSQPKSWEVLVESTTNENVESYGIVKVYYR